MTGRGKYHKGMWFGPSSQKANGLGKQRQNSQLSFQATPGIHSHPAVGEKGLMAALHYQFTSEKCSEHIHCVWYTSMKYEMTWMILEVHSHTLMT